MKLLRSLIREQIRKILQDDALFRHHSHGGIESEYDHPGIEDEFDEPGDQCPECEKSYPDPCPGHITLCSVEPDWS